MHRMKNAGYSVVATVLALFFLSGCTSVSSRAPLEAGAKETVRKAPGKGWWYAGFRIDWPQDADPNWYVDTMIAHRVILPVLNQYKEKIDLWRFHRRAARDQAGHNFSFIFYSSPKTADRIYQAIKSNPDLVRMEASGLIVRVSCDDTGRIEKPNIEDTSDKHWSEPVQKSWPRFIMGVSEMWLDLICRYYDELDLKEKTPLSLEDLKEYYRQINNLVERAWEMEGGHALLHHLNAIFGYEPVIIKKTYPMQF